MASIRKRYADRVEASPRHDGPSVTTPPTGAAKLPDPVVDSKPPEMPATESPVDKAAKEAIALQLRLQEMERAEQLQKEAVQQQPPHAAEPQRQQQPQQPMPAQVQKWLNEHPEYCDPNDQVAQAEIYTATLKCNRDGKSWDQPDFIPALERHLGLAPRSNGHAEQRPAPAAPPRYAAPPRQQQQRSTVPMSAPPSRDVPSFSTGRPQGGPVRLTDKQREAAQFSGVSEEEYARQLVKMNRMKAEGLLDDNGRR